MTNAPATNPTIEQRPTKADRDAIDKFVREGKWPTPGTLPVKWSFRKRLGGF